jgi:transcriptional regulator with XRE-family HTH domain
MPREVVLKLKLPPGWTRVGLAKRLGVSEGTLRGYMENRWTVLDRTVLEQLADFYQCDAASLIATTQSGFFEPFRVLSGKEKYPSRPTCLYLRRSDADIPRGGRTMAYRDNRAIERVDTLFQNCVEGLVGLPDAAATGEQFEERLLQNCVVLGSPMVNPASEMALCRILGVEPFNPSQSVNLPFAFKTAVSQAPETPSSVRQTSSDGKLGIWLRDEETLLEADSWPPEKFRLLQIDRGRDCAIVAVMNHEPAAHPGYFRKLVVLAGFAGLATEAAAKALVEHYRDLEPRGGEACVWGAIEVFYRKDADSMKRELVTYNWRFRRGGRCPLDFANKRP